MGRAVALIAGLVLATALLSTESATAQESNKFLSENSGNVGDDIAVTCTACLPDTEVLIVFGDEVIDKVTTDAEGSFHYSFKVPNSPADDYRVSAIRASDGEELRYDVFTIEPKLTLTPDEGSSPSIVIAEGTGFASQTEFDFDVNIDAKITPKFPNSATDCRGRFKVSLEISVDVRVTQATPATVTAVDRFGNPIATAEYTLLPPDINIDEGTLRPAIGATNVPPNTSFGWQVIDEADHYMFELATDSDFVNIIVSAEPTTPAYQLETALDYETNYFWRVKAISGTSESNWATGTFITMAEPVEAPAPPPPAEAPTITIPPVQQVAPKWIYAVIGVGATLAVVVIVLIVRTRKP